jgi:glutaconate CoA-transferase subunit A
MAKIVTLEQAISTLVKSGKTVALEGFTHLIPFAAAHEIMRQKISDLTLIRLTPDLLADQMIGAGCISKLIFSWGGNPGVGSLHRFRDAIENGWPRPIEIEEHTHAGLVNRYVAGASGLPFMPIKAYLGTDLLGKYDSVKVIDCPFTGKKIALVASLNPDVSIIHAQRADKKGNVQIWGIVGIQKEALLAGKASLVTVEEIVDELSPVPGGTTIPGWAIDFVAEAPRGAHPSYADGYYERDNEYYKAWDSISRDRESFLAWLSETIVAKQESRQRD